MAEHRVLAHLGLRASEYDAAIRRYIPAYEEMLAAVVAVVARTGSSPLVVDLGAGTGALSAAVLDGIPGAKVRLVDVDPAMLEAAGMRVAAHAGRAELARASFEDPLPPCDAVIASLALHHLPDRRDKQALYARIRAALRPGGVLAIADATVHEGGPERALNYAQWARSMAAHGIDAAEAEVLFAKWAGEDRYYPLAVELELLAAAGFPRADCFWKHGPMTVFGGFR